MTNTDNNAEGKVKTYLKSRWGEFAVLTVLSALALLFTVILFSVKLTSYYFAGSQRGNLSLWSASFFYIQSALLPGVEYIYGFNKGFIGAFVAVAVLYAAGVALLLIKRNNIVLFIASIGNALLNLACIVICLLFGLMRGGAVACGVISTVFCMAAPVIAMFIRKVRQAEKISAVKRAAIRDMETAIEPISPAKRKKYLLGVLISEIIALVVPIIAFFIPLYSAKHANISSTAPIAALASGTNILVTVVFALMVVALFAGILYFVSTVSDWMRSDILYVKRAGWFITDAAVFDLVYFIVGFGSAFFFNTQDASVGYYTVSYVPLILSTVVLVVYSVFGGKFRVRTVGGAQTRKHARVEPLIAEIVITAVTYVSLALNIVKIHIEYGGSSQRDVALSGYKLLSEYQSLESGFQALAFLEAAVLLVSGILFVVSLLCFFSKDKNFYKVIKTSAIVNFLFVFAIGLFGLYFKMAQKINIENITSVLKYYGITVPEDSYVYDVSSQTIYMLIASFAVMVWMIVRGMFGLGTDKKAELAADKIGAKPQSSAIKPESADVKQENAAARPESSETAATAAQNAAPNAEPVVSDFDACPAFTELDEQRPRLAAELEEKRARLFDSPTLPNIVRFVVDYARECRLHLSYSVEDMANFVAGLGASRLTILQGMSGTGKTSLPKIFTEAVMGRCEIVEVESSWRDKNELLGYYNEFSKCFTPKKFTQVLYRARLDSTVPTFIVLDEMNLSRIEYYFSDFLSLMENEEDKREIKLSNVKLFRTENGQKIPYAGLTDGHTVKIPANVWFIGTANRDESTFEISDKVYDRAQTMNFNKRAPKIYSFGAPLDRRFVPYDVLAKLFEDAKNGYVFDAENNAAIQKAEKLLAPYNISFGNRVLRQIEDFVKIYCACFGDRAAAERDAVERILLSKVVSKLENKIVENKEALAAEFDKLGLKDCGAFIRKLSED